MPTTIAFPVCSARMPASLAPPASTSLGHFRLTSRPAWPCNAATTETPASNGSQPRLPGGTAAGRSKTEKVSAAPGWLCQLRSSRPRPRVCSSATSTEPASAPALAAASRSWFVDPVLATTVSSDQRSEAVRIAARRAVSSSGARSGSIGESAGSGSSMDANIPRSGRPAARQASGPPGASGPAILA